MKKSVGYIYLSEEVGPKVTDSRQKFLRGGHINRISPKLAKRLRLEAVKVDLLMAEVRHKANML